MFVRDWPELLTEVSDLEAPADVTPYVMARINAAQFRPPGPARSGGGSSVRARLSALPLGWVAAVVGGVLVLGVLAVAAHSRREAPVSDAPVVSAAKLAVLRDSFAPHQFYRRSASVAEAESTLQFGLIRPQSTLVSDANLDSVWTSKTRQGALIWKSGVTETISRWTCHCDPVTSLKKMAGTLPPFRYLTIGGSPAIVAPSAPGKRDIVGILSEAQAKYGQPASVQVVRDGLSITLYQYGRNVLPDLIAAAHKLVSPVPAPIADPSSLILSTWLDPPQAEIKARPGDKVLEVQTVKHLTGPQEVAVEWVAAVRALTTPSVRIVGVGFGDIPKEQVNTAAKGAAAFTFHDRPKPIRHALSSAELRALATTRAADIGLRLTQLAVIGTPLGPAVSIIATPTDGDVKAFAKKSQSPGALLKLPVVGTLVQVVDPDNKVALADGEAFGTWIWVEPSLHLCQGLSCQ